MLKYPTIFLMFLSFLGKGQKVSVDEFKQLVGHWNGSLTYQDYTSGKPTVIDANIDVTQLGNTNTFLFSYQYPKEPAANNTDTIVLLKEGKMIGDERVFCKVITPSNGLIIITQIKGVDGNDNKKALLIHTYIAENNTLVIKKDVKFKGQKEAINRNVYSFHKNQK